MSAGNTVLSVSSQIVIASSIVFADETSKNIVDPRITSDCLIFTNPLSNVGGYWVVAGVGIGGIASIAFINAAGANQSFTGTVQYLITKPVP